jgi:hypothetical protein
LAEVGRIKGLLCFFNERVQIEIDGDVQGCPETPWTRGVKSEPVGSAR